MSEWISPDVFRLEQQGAHWMEFDGIPTNETINIRAVGGNPEWFEFEYYNNDNYRTLALPFSGPIPAGWFEVFYVGPDDGYEETPYVDLQILVGDAPAEDLGVYSQPSIVPAAVSSELDNHGEERIHIAPYEDVVVPTPPEVACATLYVSPYENPQTQEEPTNMPSWWFPEGQFAVRFPGHADVWYFYYSSEGGYYEANGEPFPFEVYEEILRGEVAEVLEADPENYQWSCLHATTYTPS